jgi:electron transport complex protein RnfC
MARRRFGTFTGGIDLPEEKADTLRSHIEPAADLSRLRVPLAICDAAPAEPVVEAGAMVTRDERIAVAAGGGQVDVFAPSAGRVGGRCEVLLPGPGGDWRTSPALELVDVEPVAGIRPGQPHFPWRAADGESLLARIAEGGVPTFGYSPRPLQAWLRAARSAGVDTLIADVLDNTPHAAADHRLLAEHGSEVARGLAILARVLRARTTMLAVDQRRTGAYRDSVAPAHYYGIQTVALPHKYPIGAPPILTKVLTRREVRPGGGGLQVGVAVTDATTCWAAYRWVACNERPVGRVVTVSGSRARERGNRFVPFGAEMTAVLSGADARGEGPAVAGSAMSGRPVVADAVCGPATSELLALPAVRTGLPTQCIRCGWCTQLCPARLNVAALNDDFELVRIDGAERRGALACMDCGICTYVCPARLPLARRVARLKRTIRAEQAAEAAAEGAR